VDTKMSTYLGLRSIDELVNYTYNRTPDEILKAGFSTTDPGTGGNYNPLFGAMAWANFNMEANIFAALPKYVWDFSGWRIFKTKAPELTAVAGAIDGKGGTIEGGAIAAAIKPAVQEITVKPKTLQYVFEASELLEQLVDNSRDDNYGSLAQQRVYASDQFKERVNLMLAAKPTDVVATHALEELNLESLDVIVSASAEQAHEAHANVTSLYTPWFAANGAGVQRNGATVHDSTVKSPSGTLGTTDVLTDAVLRETLAEIRIAAGKEPTVMIGGQDTYSEVQSIYMNAYRIQNTADLRTEFSVGVNGVDTFTGTGAGLHISTIYGLPFIPSKDIGGSGAGKVDNLYILNTSADKNAPNKPLLGMQILKPIVYYEAGKRQQGYPFINEAFTDRALYNMLGETTCRNFKAQAKIRDIASGI
tara:strand:+ start:1887 stop:3143 length:1257 start_codon:yes stop_codon:yes gene_type:complete